MANCLEAIRRARHAAPGARLDMNHVWLHIWPPVEADLDQLTALQGKIAPITAGAGIEEVRIQAGRGARRPATPCRSAARFSYQPGSGRHLHLGRRRRPSGSARSTTTPQKVVRARRRGLVYPYELQAMVAGAGAPSSEHDLDDTGRLVPVDRPYGTTRPASSSAVVTTPTPLHPEGVSAGAVRRPAAGARRRRRAGVRADHRRARPRRARAGAGRVVRAVGRRPHLDGLRHREHGLGGPARSSGSSSSPRPAARSTSSSPASTSAPSPTGTPRRRCSCTPRASSS